MTHDVEITDRGEFKIDVAVLMERLGAGADPAEQLGEAAPA